MKRTSNYHFLDNVDDGDSNVITHPRICLGPKLKSPQWRYADGDCDVKWLKRQREPSYGIIFIRLSLSLPITEQNVQYIEVSITKPHYRSRFEQLQLQWTPSLLASSSAVRSKAAISTAVCPIRECGVIRTVGFVALHDVGRIIVLFFSAAVAVETHSPPHPRAECHCLRGKFFFDFCLKTKYFLFSICIKFIYLFSAMLKFFIFRSLMLNVTRFGIWEIFILAL